MPLYKKIGGADRLIDEGWVWVYIYICCIFIFEIKRSAIIFAIFSSYGHLMKLMIHHFSPPSKTTSPPPPIYTSRMFTTQRMQSPSFIASNARLISSSVFRCVINSSTFSLPVI